MRYIFILLLLGLLGACNENDRMVYDSNMHDIYYNVVNDKRDSVYVSLLTADEVLDFSIEVNLLGDKLKKAARFEVEVVPEMTTAVEGVHYKALPQYYEFPVDTFTYNMPIQLIKGDEKLTKQSVVLTLRLVPGEDLGIAYENRSVIRVVIADMLKKPEGEGFYGDMTSFRTLFGEYSRVKHTMIIEMTGHDFWDGNYGNYGGDNGIYYEMDYYTPYARKLYKIITENEIRDENGKIMQGWMVP